ncbi:hypothetical protein [Mesorhizobium sp. M0460]|uniref:hypothetical protein n=1 Tax=unclassified Mesorhizobium TaxID=325217 RepID=UPI00333A78DF
MPGKNWQFGCFHSFARQLDRQSSETHLDYPALADEDFLREHAACLGGHATSDDLKHVRTYAAVVRKLLCAELDAYTCHLTPKPSKNYAVDFKRKNTTKKS